MRLEGLRLLGVVGSGLGRRTPTDLVAALDLEAALELPHDSPDSCFIPCFLRVGHSSVDSKGLNLPSAAFNQAMYKSQVINLVSPSDEKTPHELWCSLGSGECNLVFSGKRYECRILVVINNNHG